MIGIPRASLALLLAAPLFAGPAQAQATAAGIDAAKQGYWWYAPPLKPDKPSAPDPDALLKPVIPPMAELATFTPPKIRKLIEQQRDYAATVLLYSEALFGVFGLPKHYPTRCIRSKPAARSVLRSPTSSRPI